MKKNSFKIGVALAYLLIVVNIVYGFVVTPFLVRQLNPTNYGAYQTISHLTGVIAVLDFGISAAVVRFVSKYYSEKDKKSESKYLGACFYQAIAIIIFLLIGGIILYTQLSNIYGDSTLGTEVDPGLVISKKIYLLLMLNCVISIPGEIFNAIIIGHKKYAFANLTKTLKVVIQLVLMLVIVPLKAWNGSAISICVVLLSATSFFTVVDFLYIHFKLKVRASFRIKSESKWLFKESFIFMLLTFVQSVLIQFEGNLDVILIGKYLSPESVTLYSIALLFYSMFNQLSTAISNLLLPKVSQIIADGGTNKELEDLTIRVGRIQFILLGGALFGFISLGNIFIYVWQGPGFEIVWPLTIILLVATFIPLFQNGCLAILRAKNKILFRTIAITIGAVFNFAFTFLALYLFNCSVEMKLICACLGTAISLIGANVIAMNIYYKKALKLDIFRIFKGIFARTWLCLVPPFIVTFIYGQIVSFSWAHFFLGVAIFVVIYAVLLIAYGLNNDERKMFFSKIFSNDKGRVYENDNNKLVLYPVSDNSNHLAIYHEIQKKFDIDVSKMISKESKYVLNDSLVILDETTSMSYSHDPSALYEVKELKTYKIIIIICHKEYLSKYKKAYGFGFSLDEKVLSKKPRVYLPSSYRISKDLIKSKAFINGLFIGFLSFFSCLGIISVSSNHLPEKAAITQISTLGENERYVCKIKPFSYPVYPYFSKEFLRNRHAVPSMDYFYSDSYGYSSYYAYVETNSFIPFYYVEGDKNIPFNMFASKSLILNDVESFEKNGMTLLCKTEVYEDKTANVFVVSDDFAIQKFGSAENAIDKTVEVKLYSTDLDKRTQRNFRIVGVYEKETANNLCADFSKHSSFFTNYATVELGWSGMEHLVVLPTREETAKDAYLNINMLLDNYSYNLEFYTWNKENDSFKADKTSEFYKCRAFTLSSTRITLIVTFALLFAFSTLLSSISLFSKTKDINKYRSYKTGYSASYIASIIITMILSLFMCLFWTHKLYTFSLVILPVLFTSVYIFILPRFVLFVRGFLKNENS